MTQVVRKRAWVKDAQNCFLNCLLPKEVVSTIDFGSRLIEQALPGQLQGEARLRFEPDGLSCEVNIPLSVMQERSLAVVAS